MHRVVESTTKELLDTNPALFIARSIRKDWSPFTVVLRCLFSSAPALSSSAAMAALSGLSTTLQPAASLAIHTWSDLHRRQQRVVSAIGEAERRILHITQKLERLGWQNPHSSAKVEGPEWVALQQRQQKLLQAICAVRERVEAAGHRLGLTSAPHTESVAAPQLAKKVPSHFNNVQLRTLIREAAAPASAATSRSTPLYPLNKLLVLVMVRDLQRFIASGGNSGQDEATILAAKSAATSSASAANAAAASSSSTEEDLSGLSLAQLLVRLVHRLCCIDLSPAGVAQMLAEGPKLAVLSLQIDKDTRLILNEEPYVLGADNLKPSAAFTTSSQAFHAKQSRSWFSSGVSPFAHFQFTRDPKKLREAERVPCSRCGKPSSLYCPFCLLPTLSPSLAIPSLQLPMHVDIIHHVGENVKKSTSIHACILAPDSARLLEFPRDLPEGGYDHTSTVLLYPTPDAVYLDDPSLDVLRIRRVLVIESTWSKSDIVSSHPSLSALRKVKIRERESTFWRYQELGRHFLSTLEAIYWVQKEFEERKRKVEGSTAAAAASAAPVQSIDDLLYLYAFQHSRITDRYKTGNNVPRSWSGGIVGANAPMGAGADKGRKATEGKEQEETDN